MKIFVSSTYRDLKADRAAVSDVLNRIDGVEAVRMEDFFASHHPPIKECLDRLAECDAVVLLLGSRYGTLDATSGLSVTELEYRKAKGLGIPVFPFVKKIAGNWESVETDSETAALHERFKTDVELGNTRVAYQAVDGLKLEVALAIDNYRVQHGLVGSRISAFQSPEQFFHKFSDPATLFSHAYAFFGRRSDLDRLGDFPRRLEQRVLVVTGRGGIGKTRLLKEGLARIVHGEGAPSIRVIRAGIEFTADAARQLPAGPVLVVADDAHRLDGLSDLLAVAQQYPGRIKLVLTVRPHGLPGLRRRLVEAGYGAAEIGELAELGDLSRAEIEQLARAVLGPAFAHHADALVSVSRDSPLVTVVGGRLLVDERIPPTMLANSGAFRFEVFDKFAETYTDALSDHDDRKRARRALEMLAGLAPFRPDRAEIVERAAGFLALSVPEFRRLLGELEKVGLVRRVGFSLRIAPDVLSDFFLQEACIGSGGEATGYADELFAAFWPMCLESLLRNLSELDWRVRRNAPGATLLARLWEDLREIYGHLHGYGRASVVDAVATVAALQPEPALDFARFAIEDLEPPPPPPDETPIFRSARDLVLQRLPQILAAGARHESLARQAIDMLWRLRADYSTDPRHHPEHPIRVLQELAAFAFDKPDWIYDTVLDRVAAWLRRADAFEGRWSPLDVLDGLLGRDGRVGWVTQTDGLRYQWQEFEMQASGFGPYRRRGLDLLELQLVQRTEPLPRLRLLKSLADATWTSHQLAGKGDDAPEELDARESENARILGIVDALLTGAASPVLSLLAAEHVDAKVVEDQLTPREENLRAFLAAVPSDERMRLTDHLRQGDVVRPLGPGRWQSGDELLTATAEEADVLVRGLLDRLRTVDAVKRELESVAGELTRYGVLPEPGPFLVRLVQIDPVVGKELAGQTIADAGSLLRGGLVGLILPLRELDPPAYAELLTKAVESGDAELVRLGAVAISRMANLTETESGLLATIAKFRSPTTASATIQALRPLFATDPDRALRLIVAIDLGGDPQLADELCGVILDRRKERPIVDLPEHVIAALLGKFVALEEIGESFHHLRMFLDWLSARDPVSVAGMFLDRVRHAQIHSAKGSIRYRPVPFAAFWVFPTRRATPDARQAALRLVRDATLDQELDAGPWLSDLYVATAAAWDDGSLGVLTEWIEDGSPENIARVGTLLTQADENFVFDQEAFTVRLLRAADAAGAAILKPVQAALRRQSSGRVAVGSPGEPMPSWIARRDRARSSRERYAPGSVAAVFYGALETSAEAMIEHDRMSWEEDERF